jgi:hypothetical protein
MFGRRPDATLAEGIPPIRRFMPFISPRRNESLVFFRQELDVEAALAFVEASNRDRPPERPMTLFHLVLRAITKVLDERPRLNRFTAGGRIWQRDGIYISFSAKMRFDDDAPILTVKRRFDPKDALTTMVDRLHESLAEGRSGKRTAADSEMGLLLRLPPFLARWIMRAVAALDHAGLLPLAMIEPDPMHASVFVANLGSVGLDAGYHHLWEFGNIPIFCVMGRIEGEPGARRVICKWTYDERVEDGLYCARSLERLKELLGRPEEL